MCCTQCAVNSHLGVIYSNICGCALRTHSGMKFQQVEDMGLGQVSPVHRPVDAEVALFQTRDTA